MKARSLEATFPTKILFVTSVLLPEQNTTRKERVYENATRMLLSCVQEPYKIYEMYEMYKMYEMYEEYEVESIWDSTVFAKESEASHLLAGDPSPWYDSRSTWEPALAV